MEIPKKLLMFQETETPIKLLIFQETETLIKLFIFQEMEGYIENLGITELSYTSNPKLLLFFKKHFLELEK